MGLFNFFSKPSRPWQVHYFKLDGARPLSHEDIQALSQPQDRPGAMAIIGSLEVAGVRLDRVTYSGKPISRTQLENLVSDAHVWTSLLESAGKNRVSLDALNKAQMNDAFAEATKKTVKTLAV